MYKRFIKKIVLVGSVIMFFYSCIDKNYDISSADSPQLKPQIPLPIGFLEKNVSDFLQESGMDTTLLKQENGVLYILYRDTVELTSGNAVQFGNIPPVDLPFISDLMQEERTVLIPVGGGDDYARIDSAMLVNSDLTITVESKIPEGTLTLRFPKGIVFENDETVSIPFKQGKSTEKRMIKDNSILRLNTTDSKTMAFPITASLDTKGSSLSPSNSVIISIAFSNLNNKILWGYFGGMNFDKGGDKYAEISVFDEIAPTGSHLEFANPQIKCDVQNYIGFAAHLNINGITAIGKSSEAKAVFDNGTNSFVAPLKASSTPFQSQNLASPLIFNKDNGQTDKLFNVYPETIRYNLTAEPDNDSNHSGGHFLVNGKYIDVILETKLPLSFKSAYIVNTDTLDFDMSNNGVLDDLNDLALWVEYKNRLPFGIRLDVLFLDKDRKQILVELVGDPKIESAPVDSHGQTTAEKEGEFKLTFKGSDSTDKIKYIVLKTTTNSGMATLKTTDYIRLNLSARAKVKIDL